MVWPRSPAKVCGGAVPLAACSLALLVLVLLSTTPANVLADYVQFCCALDATDACDPAFDKGPISAADVSAAAAALAGPIAGCTVAPPVDPDDPNEEVVEIPGRNIYFNRFCTNGAGFIVGDPHIGGFDGSTYLLWGKPNTTYNLLSQRSHHVNVRLYHPPGRAEAHALYIDAVGILINNARIGVHLVTAAGKNASIALSTSINGVEQPAGTWAGHPATHEVDSVTSYTFKAADFVEIASTEISLSVRLVENDHLDMMVSEVATYWDDVHGVMGQTHKAAFKVTYNYAKGSAVGDLPTDENLRGAAKKKLHLQGKEDDYITSGLLAADDKFSRFRTAAAAGETVAVTRKLLALGGDERSELSAAALGHGTGVLVSKVKCDAGAVARGLLVEDPRPSALEPLGRGRRSLLQGPGTPGLPGYTCKLACLPASDGQLCAGSPSG